VKLKNAPVVPLKDAPVVRLTYSHICSSVISAVGTRPAESLQLTDRLLAGIGKDFAALAGKVNTQLEILYTLLFDDLSTKAICIRTRNYEAFDLLPRVMRLFRVLKSRTGESIGNHDLPFDDWIFPHDFSQSDTVAADGALMAYLNLLMNWQGCDFFLGVVGNASFSDGILDVLNNGARPIFSRSGFSIRLNTNPNFYMRFLFIVNQSDLERRETTNSVPLPLTDRLASVYLDLDVYNREILQFLQLSLPPEPADQERGDAWRKRQNLEAELKQIENAQDDERKLQRHELSECRLLHDYVNRFHTSVDSLMFSARPLIWLKHHSPLRIVSDVGQATKVLKSEQFAVDPEALDQVEPGKIVVYTIPPDDAPAHDRHWQALLHQYEKYTTRLKEVQARNTGHIILVVFEVTDAVDADFLTDASRSVEVMVASRVSESIVTRYFCDLMNKKPTLVVFSGERPKFSPDFRVVNASAAGTVDLGDRSLIGIDIDDDKLPDWDALSQALADRINSGTAGGIVMICPVHQDHSLPHRSSWRRILLPLSEGEDPGSVTWTFPSFSSFVEYFRPPATEPAPIVLCGDRFDFHRYNDCWVDWGNHPDPPATADSTKLILKQGVTATTQFNQKLAQELAPRVFWFMPPPRVTRPSINGLADLHPYLTAAQARNETFVVIGYWGDRPEERRDEGMIRIGEFVCWVQWDTISQRTLETFSAEITAMRVGYSFLMGIFIGKSVESPPSPLIHWDTLPRPSRIFEERDLEFSHQTITSLVESLVKRGRRPRGVITTRSCMMERLFAHGSAGAKDSVRLSYMKSSGQVEDECRTGNVFLAANTFVDEDFRQVKCILTKLKRQSIGDSAFIIYHLPSNEIPSGLISTLEWPVFWVECISISPLKDISLSEIVDCCLNPDSFKWSDHQDLLRVVVRKLMEDMTHSYKMEKFELPGNEYSEEYQQLLCLFLAEAHMRVDSEQLPSCLRNAEPVLNRFIGAVVDVLVALKARTDMRSFSGRLLRKLKHPTQFLHVNLKQEFYLALRGVLSPHVFQTIKILLNGNRSLPSTDADHRKQIRAMLDFVASFAQWFPPASQIVGRVWTGSPKEPFFADLLLSILNRFFSPASYTGPLRPARAYFASLFEKGWLCNADIYRWTKDEFPTLARDYSFTYPSPSLFDGFFASLLSYRAYGFHCEVDGEASEFFKDRRQQCRGSSFTRTTAFSVSSDDFARKLLLSDFHGVWNMDGWSSAAAAALPNWVLAFRPVWQFQHGETVFITDRKSVV
jgi:hypothetical protein